MLSVLEPVISSLFLRGEQVTTRLSWRPERPGTPADLYLEVSVGRETGWVWLWTPGAAPETPAELCARVASELSDWIAESGFAWGQLRVAGYPQPPPGWDC